VTGGGVSPADHASLVQRSERTVRRCGGHRRVVRVPRLDQWPGGSRGRAV